MTKTVKAGAARSFRPKGKVEERLNYADELGLNVSEIINQVLEDHLRPYLEKWVQDEREKIEARRVRLTKALNAEIP